MEFCETEEIEAILVVRINRPASLNALHSAAHFELADVFDRFEANRSLRVAIITGSGDRAFCAGNDLKVQAAGGTLDRPASGFGGLATRFDRTKPVIAAINGLAVGGGCEIVAACDIAVCAENASFSLPEVRVGLVSTVGSQLLIRMLGMKDVLGLLLTGRQISAVEALRIGFINEIVPVGDALKGAMRWAGEISRCSPSAVRATLDIVRRGAAAPSAALAINAHYQSVVDHRASADFVEGPRAFAQKRPPIWAD